MTLKFVAGLTILFIAFMLQFWLASVGWYTDLSYAALISFAFVFGFWELLALVLIAVFIINWQPAPSVEIFVFALFPLVVYFSRNILRSQPWFQDFLAIVIGFSVLYLSVARAAFYWNAFLADLVGGILFASIFFFPLYRWGKA